MAFEPNQVNIDIKGVPQTITPTITPTPNYYLSSTLTYSAAGNCWEVSIWSSNSEALTYTISATGYDSGTLNVSQNYTGNLEITLTEAKPEHLYAWTDSDISEPLYAWTNGNNVTVYTKTLNIIDSSTMTTNDGNGTIVYDNVGNEESFVISHSSNTIELTLHGGGSNN